MKEVTSIYITSWNQYNGGGIGGWFALEDLTEENYISQLKQIGLNPEGRDEELVIHDYDDYEFSGALYKLFGESHPLTVIKFYEKWEALEENEKITFIGLLQTVSDDTALDALEDEELSNYIVLDEDGFTNECEEFIASYLSSYKMLDSIYSYIDWEIVGRELSYDWSEFDYKGEGYFIREC